MRIDKWIWATRMVKSRTLATQFCKLGKVFLNDISVKAAKEIQIGDTIRVQGKSQEKIYQVKGFIAKPSTEEKVAPYFTDLTPPPAEISQEKNDFSKKDYREIKKKYKKDQGRPVKRDRRKLERFKESWE